MVDLTAVIDNDEAIKKLKELQNVAKSTTSSIVKDSERIDDGFSKIENTLKGLVAGISMGALVRQLVQVRGEVQQLEVAFETMLGSKAKADKLVGEAVQLAAKTPFGLQDVSNGAKMLLAYGSAAEEVTEEIKMLGNIASGLSIPLNDLIYLYGTTRTQGRMFTMDLRQFMGRGIPLAEELAKQFGVTKDKVGELVTAGKVGFDDMAKALQAMTGEGGQFYNLMEKQSETLTGQISNLEDSIYQMFNAIGEKSEGTMSGAISVASSLVENYERVGRVLMSLVATYGTYKAAIVTYNVVTAIAANAAKGMAVAEQARMVATLAAEKAQKLLNKAMLANPWVLAATAVAGLVTLIISQKNETERLREAEEEYNNAKQETINKEEEHKRVIDDLLKVAGDEANSTDTRRAALHNLIQKYPEVFAKYDTEIAMLNDIKRIKLEIAQIEAGKSITNPQNELAGVRAEIAKWYEEEASYIERLDPMTGKWKKTLNVSPKQRAKIAALEKREAELQKEIKENNRQTYLDNASQLSDAQITSELKRLERGQELLKMYNTLKSQPGKLLEAQGYLDELGKQGLGGYDEGKLLSEITKLKTEQDRRNAPHMTAAQWLQTKKKAWDDAEKAYKDFQKNKDTMSKEEYEKQSQDLKDAADLAKKEYQKYAASGGKKTKDTTKEAENKAKKAFEISQKIQAEAEASTIELMNEGTAKKLAQIDHDYEQQKIEIEKKERELMTLQGELTEEQIANFDKLYKNLNKKRIQDRIDAAGQSWEDYHIQYGSDEERAAAINSKYNRLIGNTDDIYAQQMLEKQRKAELDADINALDDYYIQLGTLSEKIRAAKDKYERQIANAKNEAERKTLEAERDALLTSFKVQASEWAKEITDMSTSKLNKMLQELQTEVEAKEEAFAALDSSDSAKAEEYRKTIETLKAKIAQLQAELGMADRKTKDGKWEDAAQIFQGISSNAKEAADAIESVDEGMASVLRGFADGVSIVGSLVSAINMVTAAATVAQTAMGWLALITIAIQVVSKIIQITKENEEATRRVTEAVDNYTNALRALNEERERAAHNTIFGDDSFGQMLTNLEIARDRLVQVEELYSKIQEKGVPTQEFTTYSTAAAERAQKYYDDIKASDAALVADMRTGWQKSIGSTKNIKVQDLADFYDANGMLDLESLKAWYEQYGEYLSAEQKHLVDQLIEGWQVYYDSLESANEYLKGIFGDLGDSMTDALVDAFASGTDAVEAFGEAAEKTLEQLTKDMIRAAFIQPIIEEYEAQIEAMNKENLSPAERVERLMQMINNMQRDVLEQQEYVDAALANAKENAAEQGYDIFDDSTSQSATSKGFQAMSQETGSELNGRFTDIQGQTHRIAEAVEFCRGLQSQQLQQVQSINDTVAKIHNNVDLIASNTKELIQMRQDLSSIKTAIYDGAL